jgi:hypothetical protein
MKGMAYFFLETIKKHWKDIGRITRIEDIAQYILNKTFKGLGNLVFNKPQQTQKSQDSEKVHKKDDIDDMITKIRKDYKI